MIEIIPNWHPIFVHFTVALLSISVLLFWLARLFPDKPYSAELLMVAHWNLLLGSALTVVTVAAGFIAFNTVQHDDPSHLVMLEHRNLALGTLLLFAALVIWRLRAGTRQQSPSWGFLMAALVAFALLTSTAWHGAELVYQHGLGVRSLPDIVPPDAAGGHGHGDHAH